MIRYRKRGAMSNLVLSDILEQQFFLLRTKVSDERTRRHYRRAVRWLGEMLGRPARLEDLRDDNLAGLLSWLQMRRKQSAVTANGSHKCLACLWRWCRDRGLIQGGPTVAKLREPRRSPVAYTADQVVQLVRAGLSMRGTIAGMPAAVWFRTMLSLEFDTAARAKELRAMRWEWIDWNAKWIRVPAEVRKGGREDGCYALGDDTIAWLASIRRPNGVILGDSLTESQFYEEWRKLLEVAGLPGGRRGMTQALRRTVATQLVLAGLDATRALGHSTAAMTARHYIDPTQTERREDRLIPLRVLSIEAG